MLAQPSTLRGRVKRFPLYGKHEGEVLELPRRVRGRGFARPVRALSRAPREASKTPTVLPALGQAVVHHRAASTALALGRRLFPLPALQGPSWLVMAPPKRFAMKVPAEYTRAFQAASGAVLRQQSNA